MPGSPGTGPAHVGVSDAIELKLDTLRHAIELAEDDLDEIIRSARERARRFGTPSTLSPDTSDPAAAAERQPG